MEQDRRDLIRSVALGATCTGFVTIPNLGAPAGRGEQTDRYDTVITPPGYAFAVWAPIFAGCVAATVAQVRPWGLLTTALDRRRPRVVRAVAAAGAAAIGVSAARRRG